MVNLLLRLERFQRFRSDQMSTTDVYRSVEATTQEIIDKIHNLVMDHRKIKVSWIVSAVEIWSVQVHNILYQRQRTVHRMGTSMVSSFFKEIHRTFVVVNET